MTSGSVSERMPRSTVDPIDARGPLHGAQPAFPDLESFEALLRDRRGTMPPMEVGGPAPAEAIPEMLLSIGMMRLTLEGLISRLEAMPDLPRPVRAGLWALACEERKFAALDGYVSGLIRG